MSVLCQFFFAFSLKPPYLSQPLYLPVTGQVFGRSLKFFEQASLYLLYILFILY